MPPTTFSATEVETLLAYLDRQRRHVLDILTGLSEDDLRGPILPSGWSCIGLVNHLALDVERFWFHAVLAGQAAAIDDASDTSNAWKVSPDQPTNEVFARYQSHIDTANQIIRNTPADATPAWWPTDLQGMRRLGSHREILLHVVAETACHAGHLDAARELIDGTMWLVIT